MTINIITEPGSTLKNKTGGWRTFIPRTDLAKCIGCGTCAKVCPEACITMINGKPSEKNKPQTDYDFCKGCGVCASECPVKCIAMEKEEK